MTVWWLRNPTALAEMKALSAAYTGPNQALPARRGGRCEVAVCAAAARRQGGH
jgi:hypothetical protein